ncbi:MAG: type II toxin-antitoxin system Phd/YefM family antitoxin [Nitrospinae bacterium]|nr:type II toxin-antitoxin system Phd/YefM family antitoxin [Nitrospinota bacterium]
MIKVTATKLRNNLFVYLNKATEGETIVIERNKHEVARLVSSHEGNWRDKMNVKSEILVSPDELINPIDDIWEKYK